MIGLLEGILNALVFAAGASVFSFMNVVIYRLPRKISFVRGRSHCPVCGAMLKWYDMVPVLNWFYLRGKCRGCGARISFRYPAVECLGGVLALLCLGRFGWQYSAVTAFFLMAVLTAVAFIDADTMEIPNGLPILVFVLAVVGALLGMEPSLSSRLIGFFAVSAPMLLLTLAVPGAFGGGDIKLMAAAGAFLGWKLSLVAAFLAIVSGGIYGVYLLASKRKGRKEHFAFGPFLCAGIGAAVLWGDAILNWYLQLYAL